MTVMQAVLTTHRAEIEVVLADWVELVRKERIRYVCSTLRCRHADSGLLDAVRVDTITALRSSPVPVRETPG